MKLNDLKPQPGSKKKAIRVGRGIGSGIGKTCGVGQKGQKARSGVAIKGYEGGQMPLYMRLPKVGFSNTKFAEKYAEVTLAKIQEAVDAKKLDASQEINEETLVAARVVNRKLDGIKVLGGSTVKAKLNLKVTKITEGAKAEIEKAGGKVELIVRVIAPVKKRGEKKK